VGAPILLRFSRVFAGFTLVAVTACAQGAGYGPASSKPSDFIVVSDFNAPPGIVRLDPTMGFSLNRGEPGVPRQQRAASIGRAVGFLVTDTAVDELRRLGYDAESTTNPNPGRSGYRALIVSGTFRTIDEGNRRRPGDEHSAVIVSVTIKAELPGGTIQPVQSFTVDSRAAPRAQDRNNGATRRETGVDADATNVGAAIARVVGDVARRNNWLPAQR
jgi:hypothetical protein